MIIGEGRAGKTALVHSLTGIPFTDTASTVGIGQLTCGVSDTCVDSSRWKPFKKPEKEFEAALAKIMLHNDNLKANVEAKTTTAVDANETNTEESAATVNSVVSCSSPCTSSSATNDCPIALGNKVTTAIASESVVNSSPSPIEHPLPETSDNHGTEIEFDSIDTELVLKYISDLPVSSGLTLSLFDFGGQSVFNAVHQFFLTKNGVYLLVFNMELMLSDTHRSDCLSNLTFWLNSIVMHTMRPSDDNSSMQTAPVAFVGTHKDKCGRIDDHVWISHVLYTTFARNPAWSMIIEYHGYMQQSDSPMPLWFWPVDNTLGRDGDETIGHLMIAIERTLLNCEYVRAPKPISWLKAFDEITSAARTSPYLAYDQVLNIAKACGTESNEVPEMLSFMHEMSLLMWHNEPHLRSVVIIDPVSFFVEPATMIIRKYQAPSDRRTAGVDHIVHYGEYHMECIKKENNRWRAMVERGIVDYRILSILLRDHMDHFDVLVHLLVKFGLFVPLVRTSTQWLDPILGIDIQPAEATIEVKQYLVPALMSSSSSDDMFAIGWTDQPVSRCFLVFTNSEELSQCTTIAASDLIAEGFLPNGLFESLLGQAVMWCQQTSLLNVMEKQCLFKNMAKLSFGNQRFRIMLLAQWNCVVVDIEGDSPLPVQKRLQELVNRIIVAQMKNLICVPAVPYYLGSAGGTQPPIDPSNHEHELLLIPMRELEKVMKGESILNRRGEGRALLTPQRAIESYGPWFPDLSCKGNDSSLVEYDVFISYRWGDHDSDFTAALFEAFSVFTTGPSNRAIRVFRDKKRLQAGLDFQESFSKALINSTVISPVFSCEGLERLVTHDPAKEDNVLIEYILMIECYSCPNGRVKRVFPLMFGPRGSLYQAGEVGNIFECGILDNMPEVVPSSSLLKAKNLLLMNGITPSNLIDQLTVKDIVLKVVKFLSFAAWTVRYDTVVMASAAAIVDVLNTCSADISYTAAVNVSQSADTATQSYPRRQQRLSFEGLVISPRAIADVDSSLPVIPLEALSIDNVVNMFAHMNLSSCTATIREEEIDGATLRCVRTEDELKRDLKLALPPVKLRKLFSFIEKYAHDGVPITLI